MAKTTHSELARIILDHVERLKAIPAGYMVSDGATSQALRTAAEQLIEQDKQIAKMIEVLRECRDLVPTQERALITSCLQ